MPNHIYSYKYDYHNSGLCKLESRQIFGEEVKNKTLFSSVEVDPSISPFIKCRLDVMLSAGGYAELIKEIKKQNLRTHGFKVEYLVLEGDKIEITEKKQKLRDVGFSIFAAPNYDAPSVIYSICTYQNRWYFGTLKTSNSAWRKHKKKPHSFSNSITMNIAKTLVSIATQGKKSTQLLDACCGVGTVMLEACFAGFEIEGCDIHPGACGHTMKNLAHYGYVAKVHHSDIKDLNATYDAVIIDLPYNLYSVSDDANTSKIIESTAKLAPRLVIVSISDIKSIIQSSGLKVIDFCTVEKRGKSKFMRTIWVCEKS